MTDNYAAIIDDNVRRVLRRGTADLAASLPAAAEGAGLAFEAFGEVCRLGPAGMTLAGERLTGPLGIVVSLYALHATPEPMRLEPLRAYREFPGTTPYHGAFAAHTERILVPRVTRIRERLDLLRSAFGAVDAPAAVGGDLAFLVRPFPKIALCYILYEADEDFPAAVTCLFSANADRFIPNDGLADTGEYASRRILALTA